MSLSASLLALIQKTSRTVYADQASQQIAGNSRGDMSVAQGIPEKAEVVRYGNSWHTSVPQANAFTFVAAMPTTRAELVLKNGSSDKTYLIDAIYCTGITSIAAAAALALLGQVVASHATDVTDNTAMLMHSMNGSSAAYGGNAKKAVANTAYGVTDKWMTLGQSPVGPAAAIGLSAYADLKGLIQVKPGGIFLANAIAGTAAGTGIIGVIWHEVAF